jgi:hypothetical protein
MRRPRVRAIVALASSASLSLLLLLPTAALGGAATKGSDHYAELSCDGLTGAGGTLFFGTNISDVNGASAGLDAFGPNDLPFVDPATYTADFDAAPTGSWAGGAYSIVVPVVDASGDPAGSVTIEATLVPADAPQPIDDDFRDGNHRFRSSGTFLPLLIEAGSATLPDGSVFELANDHCFADEVNVTFFGNNPTSAITGFDANNVDCALNDATGQVGNLFVDVDADRTVAFVDVFFFDVALEATTDASITNGQISQALDYYDPETGAPAGTGALDMTIAATGERFSYSLRGSTIFERVSGQVYDVAGTLTAPGFAPFDLGACVLADRTTKTIFRPAKAPKPTGAPPPNDLPSGAKSVRVGTTLTQQTKNAALDMEEPFACLTFLDDQGVLQNVPVLKTVWYSLVGTGSPVTVDTAGSGFDTVVAVYQKAADGSYVPEPDACVDDVPLQPLGRTLQASVTFPTIAGTTYYIQVGGFPDDLNWGNLHLSVR